jgi:hypothetical protein
MDTPVFRPSDGRAEDIQRRFESDPIWKENPFPMRCDALYLQRVLNVMLEGKDAAAALLRADPSQLHAWGLDNSAMQGVLEKMNIISESAAQWLRRFAVPGALRLRGCEISPCGVVFYCKMFIDEAARRISSHTEQSPGMADVPGSCESIMSGLLSPGGVKQAICVQSLFRLHQQVAVQCTALCALVPCKRMLSWTALVQSHAPGPRLSECMNENALLMENMLWTLMQEGAPKSDGSSAHWNVVGENGAAFRLLKPNSKVVIAVEQTARVHGCLSAWASIVGSRRTVMCTNAKDCAALMRLAFFSPRLSRREPHSDVRGCFETLVYSFHMPLYERAQYLQNFPDQTKETPLVTIMNSVMPPDVIREWQSHLNGWTLCRVFADGAHPFEQLCLVAVFGCRFQDLFHTSFMDRFWVAGFQTQDRLDWLDQSMRYGHLRDPIVVCLFGHWFVAEGTSLLLLCKSPAEALAVWLLLVHALRNDKLSDGLDISCLQQEVWTAHTPNGSASNGSNPHTHWSDTPAIRACVDQIKMATTV